ncbi:MAG: hypothetical protein A3J54_02435 [Candidatus Ryanbacteria bacterium RIFCSPHIGHO2_02_FULL_45_13b]|uniref:Methenyltetrahydrofolate cyclohydrolase n=1 Tax=Candidatus Ryanbacteria bacterium RIFCSPHIGHO2_02_FULL_45_13b TaxID=1802117 RepID=A0A1G2G7V5_9BACT|nr:MAG: hypothetical protein A3J54_02435 [Candidatus Ryanbacteria bacterium RIFCSPHIGHO2_02_FULL_45_13b]
MIVDCKKISDEMRALIQTGVVTSRKKIRLAIVKASHHDATKDAETEAFLKQKRICGKAVGIEVREYDVSEFLISQHALEKRVSVIARIKENDAVIVQLPLPPITRPNGEQAFVNTQAVLNSIPPKKDADVLHAESFGRYEAGSETALIPPVIGALEEILRREAPDVLKHLDASVVVAVGQGLVIGKQVNRWAVRNGVRELHSLREGSDVAYYAKRADIIVSGVGKGGLITVDMVKAGAIIFDFGFSKTNDGVCGDVEHGVADKARLLTPVPGGMGPLSVTMLFANVARIAGKKKGLTA